VTAVPNTGYTFTNWTGSGFTASTTNPLTVTNVTSNLTLTANFTQQTFTVTFAAGTGGSLTGTTSQTVAYGGSATAVTANQNTGYSFTNWTGAGFSTSATNPLTVTNVTSNLTLTANFTQQTFTVTFAAGTGGSLTGTTTQTLTYGGSATTVTAVPNTGYTFTNWTGSGFTASANNPLTVTNVTSNLTLTANFTQQTFTVTFAAGAGGTLTGITSQTVAYGGSATTVTAVPNTGYTFTNWTGSGFTASTINPLTVTNVTSNLALTANFTQQTLTVTFAAGAGGSLTGTVSQTVPYGGSATVVTAVPNTGYTFTNWTGPGFMASANNPLTVTNVTSNLTLTANFTQQTFTVTLVAGSGGTLTGITSQTVAYGGSTSAVTANPNTGYSFTNWTGAGFSTSATNPLTVPNVMSDLTLTATFTQQTFTVTFAAGAGGSLSGTVSQSIPGGTDCSQVTANPNAGYGLVNWTGTGGFVTSTANPLTVTTVGSNMNITANFSRLPVIGSFYPTASTIGRGQTAVLNWTGLNFYTSATIDNGVGPIAATNGMIFAYPTVTTTYTLTATSTSGTVTRPVTITVVQLPSNVSVTATPLAVAAGGTTTLSWSATGAASYTLQNLTAGNITVIGPTTATSTDIVPPTGTTTYRLLANNGYNGTAAATVTVTSGPPAGLTYTTLNATYLANVPITPNSPSNTGGPITSYTAVPVMPGIGISLNPSTGVITGTPLGTMGRNSYTIQGSNSYGTTSVVISIAVTDPPPSVTYPSATYALDLGTAVTIVPGSTGGPVTSWSINPTLPAGLTFNSVSGVISGTPSVISASQTYTVSATNSGGTSSPTVQISVSQTPPHIAYAYPTYTFFLNQAITALVPTNSGAAASSWSISPPLPTGITFNTSTGQISGTPTSTSSAQVYTISATNAGGTGLTTPTFSVMVQPPVITTQPYGRILSPGEVPSFSVVATGSGVLTYQWFRNGSPIGGANASSYTAPAFSLADDGAVFTVAVSDGFGGSIQSDPAVLSLLQDLATWLLANPTVANAIKWQVQSGDPFNYYIAPSEAQKLTWANWSSSQQSDLNQAYLDHIAWYNAGAQQISMVPGGTASTLTDQPTNLYSQIGVDSNSTMVQVSPAYMWRLYTGHVAFSLMLEISHQVPWTLTAYNADSLRWLFDSSTLAWLQPGGNFGMGTYPGANQPTLRNNNRPRTEFTDPRWTYPWLKQAGILGSSRLNTIGGFLDYMRQNLYHVNGGADTFGSDFAIWQYRGYSPVSKIVLGTVDSRYPGQGTQHYTEGCHGSTGFLNAALRVLNIPVQPIWVCGHEQVYFLSEDLYLDHADDPYNAYVRASNSSSLLLLIDSATWRSRFGPDETVNNWDYSSPASAWIGYTAINFK
jgi:uncharacterized repeat protein (TIGR02543 family)